MVNKICISTKSKKVLIHFAKRLENVLFSENIVNGHFSSKCSGLSVPTVSLSSIYKIAH